MNSPAAVNVTTEPWLTKREVSAELRVSVRTVERLRVPAMRVGGQNRYRMSEVEQFLRDETREAEVVELHPQGRGAAA